MELCVREEAKAGASLMTGVHLASIMALLPESLLSLLVIESFWLTTRLLLLFSHLLLLLLWW